MDQFSIDSTERKKERMVILSAEEERNTIQYRLFYGIWQELYVVKAALG
jgi:hypothetical protein